MTVVSVPSFTMQPLTQEQFVEADPNYHVFTIELQRPAASVWADLHSDRPLHWCTGLRQIRWTSASPHGVGTTREATLSNGIRVRERYFLWDENGDSYVNAFCAESANVPAFRRFGERYTVVDSDAGSRFTWEFYLEPRVPSALHRIVRLALAREVDRTRRDTLAHFERVAGPSVVD